MRILLVCLFLAGCSSSSDNSPVLNDGSIRSQLASLGLPIGVEGREVQDRRFNLIPSIGAKSNGNIVDKSVCDEVARLAQNEFWRQFNAYGSDRESRTSSSYYLDEDGNDVYGFGISRQIPIVVPYVDYFVLYTQDGSCLDWFVLEAGVVEYVQ